MQQRISRPASAATHRTHVTHVSTSENEDPGVGWKVAACIVGGYLTVISIIATGMLTVHALGVLFGAYNRGTGW